MLPKILTNKLNLAQMSGSDSLKISHHEFYKETLREIDYRIFEIINNKARHNLTLQNTDGVPIG